MILWQNWKSKFLESFSNVESQVIIISPFFSNSIIEEILKRLGNRKFKEKNIEIFMITGGQLKLSNIEGLYRLLSSEIQNDLNIRVQIKILKNLHAKIYIFDGDTGKNSKVVFSSANLTNYGLNSNIEFYFETSEKEFLRDSIEMFQYMWNLQETLQVDEDILEQYRISLQSQKAINKPSYNYPIPLKTHKINQEYPILNFDENLTNNFAIISEKLRNINESFEERFKRFWLEFCEEYNYSENNFPENNPVFDVDWIRFIKNCCLYFSKNYSKVKYTYVKEENTILTIVWDFIHKYQKKFKNISYLEKFGIGVDIFKKSNDYIYYRFTIYNNFDDQIKELMLNKLKNLNETNQLLKKLDIKWAWNDMSSKSYYKGKSIGKKYSQKIGVTHEDFFKNLQSVIEEFMLPNYDIVKGLYLNLIDVVRNDLKK